MTEDEAYTLIRTMIDMDLKLQQFKSMEIAERAAEAYSIVLRSTYVAANIGYKWVVTPRPNAHPASKRTEEVRVVLHKL